MKKTVFALLVVSIITLGCSVQYESRPTSNSGVQMAKTSVQTDPSGHSVEQNNIIERLKRDNLPGSVKHLYIISPYSGDVLIYSTVKGKVTSGGKRLTPNTVSNDAGKDFIWNTFPIEIGGKSTRTNEVVQDDGTFGSSAEYLYWFDVRGAYHQQYIGSSLIHISDVPLSNIKKPIINIEHVKEQN